MPLSLMLGRYLNSASFLWYDGYQARRQSVHFSALSPDVWCSTGKIHYRTGWEASLFNECSPGRLKSNAAARHDSPVRSLFFKQKNRSHYFKAHGILHGILLELVVVFLVVYFFNLQNQKHKSGMNRWNNVHLLQRKVQLLTGYSIDPTLLQRPKSTLLTAFRCRVWFRGLGLSSLHDYRHTVCFVSVWKPILDAIRV